MSGTVVLSTILDDPGRDNYHEGSIWTSDYLFQLPSIVICEWMYCHSASFVWLSTALDSWNTILRTTEV
jgi:hypothetical protein